MDSCEAIKQTIGSSNIVRDYSMSNNPKALEEYENGNEYLKKENYKEAIKYFEKTLKIDPNFAFCWDNLGVCYRKIGDYDKALFAYERSLNLDPYGLTALQNIGIVYMYKKQYDRAIEAYKTLAKVDENNPEVFYGIANVYLEKEDFENSLDYICKAYKIYLNQNSPYKVDAENVIRYIYAKMKDKNEEKFKEILKSNDINIIK